MKKIFGFLNPKKCPIGVQLLGVFALYMLIFGIFEGLIVNNVLNKNDLSSDTRDTIVEFITTSQTTSNMDMFEDKYSYQVINENDITTTTETNIFVQAVKERYSRLKFSAHSDYEEARLSLNSNQIYVFRANSLLVIVPTEMTNDYIDSLGLYQTLTILLLLVLSFCIIVFVNHFYISPIKDITMITSNIKKLKFSYRATGYYNKEYDTLGNEINELSDSLKGVIDNLNYKNEEITKLLKAQEHEYGFKKQLVATISHEIKTPLAVMQATISGIIDGIFSPEETTSELNNLLNEIEKTNTMLQQIVGLYKLESDQFQLTMTELDIHDMVMHTINSLSKIAEKYQQTINYENDESLLINADATQLDRVLNNVILNAITYSPKGSHVDINLKQLPKYVLLEIINYGVIIEKKDLDHLFEPFYRVDKSRQKKEDHGNGLGLYLVKEILEKHGFDYGMENIENGVKFYIIFK